MQSHHKTYDSFPPLPGLVLRPSMQAHPHQKGGSGKWAYYIMLLCLIKLQLIALYLSLFIVTAQPQSALNTSTFNDICLDSSYSSAVPGLVESPFTILPFSFSQIALQTMACRQLNLLV